MSLKLSISERENENENDKLESVKVELQNRPPGVIMSNYCYQKYIISFFSYSEIIFFYCGTKKIQLTRWVHDLHKEIVVNARRVLGKMDIHYRLVTLRMYNGIRKERVLDNFAQREFNKVEGCHCLGKKWT